jgi:TonB family protein
LADLRSFGKNMNRLVRVSGMVLIALWVLFASIGAANAEPPKSGPTPIGRTKFREVVVPVFDSSAVRIDRKDLPVYPRNLRRAGVTGEATVLVFVDENGSFVDCGLLRATEAEFGASALAVVRKWHYYPLELELGKPIVHALKVTITFELGY